jgi:diguanylate cyclase (GGDEF)-like protein
MELAALLDPKWVRAQSALYGCAFVFLNAVLLGRPSEGNGLAATSLAVALCVVLPSVLFLLGPEGSAFRRMLGTGNLAFAAVLLARAYLALTDPGFHLYSTGLVQGLTFLMLILLLVLSGTVILLIAKEEADRELRDLATRDPLTGLSNRRAFLDQATRILAYHQRYGLDVSVLFIDIDHFKDVNDHYGHAAGDQVIRHLSHILRLSIREFDLHCRYGGEEFVLLLPNSNREEGLRVAERIRFEVARSGREAVPVPYTVSVGLATSLAAAKDPLSDLLARSDAALYRAKQCGRNRVEVDEGQGLYPTAQGGAMPA